ncbi:MAG: hypothetical protein KBA53_01280 [Thermoclostridium sp.]|nr:hypothetical protein [Thermoclostridium sp.]
MQHDFSSGEVLYQQNIRDLNEGRFIAECIFYAEPAENTEYISQGTINDRKARVRFRLDTSGEEKVFFKKTMNILMQSDIFQAQWKLYEIEWLDE